MDAPQQQDLITGQRDPYAVPLRSEVVLMAVLPTPGQRVGIRRGQSETWLPFTFKGAGKRGAFFISPINGSTFSFDLRDPWEWLPWSVCPKLMTVCGSCKGTGEYTTKKKPIEVKPCRKCRGEGKVPVDDPFTA
jgi:hypothetical protein